MTATQSDTRPLGHPVPGWTPPPEPPHAVIEGRYCALEPLNETAHAARLFPHYVGHDHVWDYLPYGPFATVADYRAWVAQAAADKDQRFFAVMNRDSDAFEGVASFLRIKPPSGSIEVGNINFSPALQGTRAGTEALFRMMEWAFTAGYRRFEWKCDALNRPSRRAAQRLGFSYEGIFRQATVVKGRNRDTAWFAAIDADWPDLRRAFETWLAPGNFGADLRQRQSLSAGTAPILVARDPKL